MKSNEQHVSIDYYCLAKIRKNLTHIEFLLFIIELKH